VAPVRPWRQPLSRTASAGQEPWRSGLPDFGDGQPESGRRLGGMHHFDLLGHPAVWQAIRGLLGDVSE
jgi:hypothetical protein